MVLSLLAVSCLVAPAPAVGGYDIAHIVERTCEEGGPLVVTDEFKPAQDRHRVLTEPGDVIACPRAGGEASFQIAAGPEGIGADPYVCTYVSLRNGDGSDSCWTAATFGRTKPLLEPLIAVRVDEPDRLTLVGIAGSETATVASTPAGALSPDPTVLPIDAERAAGLGAAGAYSYFWLTVDRQTACAVEPPRLQAHDGSGQLVAETRVSRSTWLLDATDGLTHSRPLRGLCEEYVAEEPAATGWLTGASALVRSLLTLLI